MTSTAVEMGHQLRIELRRRKILQKDFAMLVGCSEKHLSRVLRGHNTAHPDTLDAWAEVLGCSFTVKLTKRRTSQVV